MLKFEELFDGLNKHGVRYLVVGGVAVNLYGIERATADIDLVVELEQGNLEKFASAANKLGLKPKVPVKVEDFMDEENREKWTRDKGMVVFSLFDPKNPFFLLDVFVKHPFDFKDVYRRRHKMKAGRTTVPVVPPDALIRMKKGTGRPQDAADVFYLKRIIKEMEDEG